MPAVRRLVFGGRIDPGLTPCVTCHGNYGQVLEAGEYRMAVRDAADLRRGVDRGVGDAASLCPTMAVAGC